MDIVQYLHGLVSSSLGINDEDMSANLLKQYYALSMARIANQRINLATSPQPRFDTLWNDKAIPLAKRLSRSFHIDETQTLALLKSATPLMMTELNNLVGTQSAVDFTTENFRASMIHLPAWSSDFIEQIPNAILPAPNLTTQDTNTPSDPAPDHISHPRRVTPQKRNLNPIALGFLSGLVALALGVSFWFFYHKNNTTEQAPSAAAIPASETLNAPKISITTGDNGTLYACQAELGNQALQNALLESLQKNFGNVNCIIDLDNNFGTSLEGLERLDSIIAMLKSEPFTSIEIHGKQIFINHPKSDVLARIVNDIGLLAPQFTVLAMPPLDKAAAISQSLERASLALNALGNPISAYELARAMSLQIIDFNGTAQIPESNQTLLTLAAQKLKDNPDIKLIIAVHTDIGNGDRMSNVTLSQSQANAVRDFLIQQGVADNQLVAKGVGDGFAITDNATELGKFKNRRTEFLVFDDNTIQALSTTPPPAVVTSEPIQMATPVAPPVVTQNTPMPVQGMPSGVVAPEPSYQQAEPIAAQPYQEEMPPPQEYTYTQTHTPQVQIPQEVLELSKTTIHSEDGSGISNEVR